MSVGTVLLLALSLGLLAAVGGPAVSHAGGALLAAHRGGAQLRPENSLLAFRNAIALGADFLESLAAIGELLIDFDDFFRHLLVRILRSSHQRKVRSGGDPLMTIRIKANPQEHRLGLSFLFLRRVRHGMKLRFSALKSSVRRRGQGRGKKRFRGSPRFHLVDYFQPLVAWLQEQNKGRAIGWE